jgi:hypothetical protein
LGPPYFGYQPGWYHGVLFVPVRRWGFFILFYGHERDFGVESIIRSLRRTGAKDNRMANDKRRSFADRLRDLLESLQETLSPRQPAPVPIPVREEWRQRRR